MRNEKCMLYNDVHMYVNITIEKSLFSPRKGVLSRADTLPPIARDTQPKTLFAQWICYLRGCRTEQVRGSLFQNNLKSR